MNVLFCFVVVCLFVVDQSFAKSYESLFETSNTLILKSDIVFVPKSLVGNVYALTIVLLTSIVIRNICIQYRISNRITIIFTEGCDLVFVASLSNDASSRRRIKGAAVCAVHHRLARAAVRDATVDVRTVGGVSAAEQGDADVSASASLVLELRLCVLLHTVDDAIDGRRCDVHHVSSARTGDVWSRSRLQRAQQTDTDRRC